LNTGGSHDTAKSIGIVFGNDASTEEQSETEGTHGRRKR